MSSQRIVYYFSAATALSTFFLLLAGALVTSTGSGLAVPDWPLSYGTLFPEMRGGVIFEHGHRMVAGFVGVLTLVLNLVLWKWEPRRWVRRLGAVALAAVVIQALLGGLTVLFRLPVAVSVCHALLAQTFFCLVVTLAWATSQSWNRPGLRLGGSGPVVASLATVTAVAFFVQLFLGALMRHSGAGLAIPDFPLSFGRVVPPFFDAPIAMHFAHRVGAVTVISLSSALAYLVFTREERNLSLVSHGGLLLAAVLFQGMLGAMVVWMKRPVLLTTLHLGVGALCLAAAVTLAIRTRRLVQQVPAGAAWEGSVA